MQTIKIFDNAIEAHVWKAKLENEGILCFLFDENMASIYPFRVGGLGGVKLKVREQDIQQVKQIFLEAGDEAVRICPVCLSVEISKYYPSDRWQAIKFAILEAFSGKHYQECQECGKIFL